MDIKLFNKKEHNRDSFNCEEEILTNYLKRQVSQDIKKRLAACFVYVDEEDNILGYYTLSSDKIHIEDIPDEYQSRIPKSYGVPVTLLGRLARDISLKGTDAGEILLVDALKRAYEHSLSIGSMAVIVDPMSEYAVKFYEKYGFIMLDSGRMFIPMTAVQKLFS